MRILPILLLSFLCHQATAQKIAFLMDDYNAERWRADSANFYKAAVAEGAEVHIFQCDSDPQLQYRQAEKAIDSLKADVLVLVSCNQEENKALLHMAKEKSTPVVLYEREVEGPYYQYLSFDSYQIGFLQGQHIAEQEGVQNIVLLNGPTFDQNAVLFREGQMAALEPHVKSGKINILLDIHLSEWTELEAFMRMNDFISSNDQPIHAVVAANDAIAKGALDVLEMNGIEIKAITGQDGTKDALKNIKSGRQTFTVIKPTDILAKEAVMAAIWASKGKKLPKDEKKKYIEMIIVTPENVDQYLN